VIFLSKGDTEMQQLKMFVDVGCGKSAVLEVAILDILQLLLVCSGKKGRWDEFWVSLV